MNARQRFNACMRFEKVDRLPFFDFAYWTETLTRWYEEGLPRDDYPARYFGLDRFWEGVPVNLNMVPGFEHVVLEEDAETVTYRSSDGITARHRKTGSSIPQFLDYPVKTLDDFRRLVAERYHASSRTRLPQYFDDYARSVRDRDYPLGCPTGGFFGQIRNWMGLENACIAFAQQPEFIHEMCDFIADFTIEVIDPVLDAVDVDYCSFWEDMAYNSGPLISPAMFREFLLPRYKRVTECIRSHGVEVITVDCDGDHGLLTPLWLEGGVNLFYPLEIRAGIDPVAMRREYGERALLMGGVDKFALAAGREAIDRVIDEVVAPLAPQLGFVPMPDHRVPPNVALDDYIYYLKRCREVTTFA